MTRSRLASLCLVLLFPLAVGCVKYPNHWDREKQGDDPFENQNRAVFQFNETMDDWVLDPVAHGWEFITWQGFRDAWQRHLYCERWMGSAPQKFVRPWT